jgi:hypothetical protein
MFLGIRAVFEILEHELRRVAGDRSPVIFHDTGDILKAFCHLSKDKQEWHVYFPFPAVSDTKDVAEQKCYTLLHEIGHTIDGRSSFDILEKYQISNKSILGYVNNLLTDHSQEHSMYAHEDAFQGIKDLLVRGRTTTMRGMLAKEKEEPLITKEGRVTKVLFTWVEAEPRGTWNPVNALQFKTEGFDDEQLEWYRKLCEGDYEQRLLNLTFDNDRHEKKYQLALELLQDVFGYTPEELEKDKQASGEEAESCEEQDSDNKDLGDKAKEEVEQYISSHDKQDEEDELEKMKQKIENNYTSGQGGPWTYVPGATKVVKL